MSEAQLPDSVDMLITPRMRDLGPFFLLVSRTRPCGDERRSGDQRDGSNCDFVR